MQEPEICLLLMVTFAALTGLNIMAARDAKPGTKERDRYEYATAASITAALLFSLGI